MRKYVVVRYYNSDSALIKSNLDFATAKAIARHKNKVTRSRSYEVEPQ